MAEQVGNDLPSTSSVDVTEKATAETPPFKLYKPTASSAPAVLGASDSKSNPANSLSHSALEDLPDDFFKATGSDLKAAQSLLSARTQSLVNQPLQLRAQREAVEKSKRDRWPETTIRIKFTDRTQLQRSFQSTEKIRSVYAFVRSSLREDVKPIKFILYQSPPKRDFKVSDPKVRNLTLAELQLSPSSVLLIRFEDEALNRSDVTAPLLSTMMEQATELPPPTTYDNLAPTPSARSKPSESGTSSGERKIPKWLKVGLKMRDMFIDIDGLNRGANALR